MRKRAHANAARVNVITLGCSKNTVDSENLLGMLRRGGLDVVHDAPGEGYAGVVINTCGFILDAKQESVDTILSYAQARQQGRIGKLVVMGCLVQRYRQELMDEIPGIDAVVGVDQMEAVASLFLPSNGQPDWRDRVLTTPQHYAYLKVSEGCDHQCSFCAIPLIRGKHISRPMDEILMEADMLRQQGVKELILIAQDLTWYGMDLYGERRISPLVEALARQHTTGWIRLHYTYPVGFPMDLPGIIQSYPQVCNYLDLPLQHISDRILSSMRRGSGSAAVRKLLDHIRTHFPNLALRTTMITGYPGETQKEYDELIGFIKEYRFERLGAFTYSHEEDTPAYDLADDVPPELKEERLAGLMEAQQSISLEHNMKLIGSDLPVLVDRVEGNLFIGRTEWDSPEIDNEVIITSPVPLQVGEFCKVRITDASDFDLSATYQP